MKMIQLRIEKLPSSVGIAYAASDQKASDKRGNTSLLSNQRR
jgi:hypothetical protein